jgi:membrane-associated phospholipid phosphatase
VLALCPLVAAMAPSSVEQVVARGRSIVEVEVALGISIEAAAHRWLSESPLQHVATTFYAAAHVPALVAALLLAWHLRPQLYERARTAFVAAHLLTVAGYVLLPTAPPRLVPALGLDDPLATLPAAATGIAHRLQYEYAAFPSGHVVFALVAGTTLAALARSAAGRAAAGCYPAVVAAVVVATGHHYVLDVVGAVVVWAAAVVVARAWVARRDPALAGPEAPSAVPRLVAVRTGSASLRPPLVPAHVLPPSRRDAARAS